jgi:hypothetical protein
MKHPHPHHLCRNEAIFLQWASLLGFHFNCGPRSPCHTPRWTHSCHSRQYWHHIRFHFYGTLPPNVHLKVTNAVMKCSEELWHNLNWREEDNLTNTASSTIGQAWHAEQDAFASPLTLQFL